MLVVEELLDGFDALPGIEQQRRRGRPQRMRRINAFLNLFPDGSAFSLRAPGRSLREQVGLWDMWRGQCGGDETYPIKKGLPYCSVRNSLGDLSFVPVPPAVPPGTRDAVLGPVASIPNRPSANGNRLEH